MVNLAQQQTARPITPLGILVEHLETAVEMVDRLPQVPAEVKAHLQKAYHLGKGLDPYLDACTTAESPALTAIAQKTAAEDWNQRYNQRETVRQLEQEMLSGHLEGQVLKMFVRMTRAKDILDIGMFTGYSALAMAEALPSDGRLVACEVDGYTAEFAQKLFEASPHGKQIQVKVAPALETLEALVAAGESFDLAFIDADKTEYVDYYETLIATSLLKPDGFICVDNTLLQGQAYLSSEEQSRNGQAIARFNEVVKNDPRVEQVLLPIRDGLTVIRRV